VRLKSACCAEATLAPAQRAAAVSAVLEAASKPGGAPSGLADQIDRLGGFADGPDNPVTLHSRKYAPPVQRTDALLYLIAL